MTTWQDIQTQEKDYELMWRWEGFTRGELMKLRKEFMQDARDSHRYGSHADAETYRNDIKEIEQVLEWIDEDYSSVMRTA